jgi:hypothetical protein
MKVFEILSEGQGEAMLAKADMLLQGTGFARKGFEIVKAPQQGMVRGSITNDALAMVKNMLAKAQALGATDAPALDPKPTVKPADIDNKEFGEAHGNSKVYDKCWDGYKKVPGKKRGEKGSCVKEDATAGATSAGAIASVANPPAAKQKIKRDKSGVPVAPQIKNADGTAKNAQDVDKNLMGGKAIKR